MNTTDKSQEVTRNQKIDGIPFRDIQMIAEVWAQQLRELRTLVNQSTWSAEAKHRWNEDVLPSLTFGVALGTAPDRHISTPLYGLIEDAIDHPTVTQSEIESWITQQTSGDPHKIMVTLPIW